MTPPRPPRRRHHHVDETPGLELPSTFAGDSHEPDRDALAWLAAGRLEAEARGADRHRHDGRRDDGWQDDGWQVVASHLADVPDSDVTREFWGDAPRRRRLSKSAAAGSIERTRTHRVVPPSADGSSRSEHADSVIRNPLFVRLAAIAVIGVLLVPLVMGVRSATGGSDLGLRTMAVSELADVLPVRPSAPTVLDAVPDTSSVSPSDAAETGEPATAGGDSEAPSNVPPAEIDEPVAAEQTATSAASCSLEYKVVAGDYWLRLADGSSVDLSTLLAANGATIETPLYPGDEVCLPEGATSPPPPTSEPVTESASASSSSSSTNDNANANRSAATAPAASGPPATAAPPTTAPPAAPAAPAAPPVVNPSEAVVRDIIREVFPDDEHEMAFAVARRESGFRADADNGWCCHGIFQIHWQAHRSWLQGQGITSSNQLYDARTNIEIAYQVYQRSGGWGPWS